MPDAVTHEVASQSHSNTPSAKRSRCISSPVSMIRLIAADDSDPMRSMISSTVIACTSSSITGCRPPCFDALNALSAPGDVRGPADPLGFRQPLPRVGQPFGQRPRVHQLPLRMR